MLQAALPGRAIDMACNSLNSSFESFGYPNCPPVSPHSHSVIAPELSPEPLLGMFRFGVVERGDPLSGLGELRTASHRYTRLRGVFAGRCRAYLGAQCCFW